MRRPLGRQTSPPLSLALCPTWRFLPDSQVLRSMSWAFQANKDGRERRVNHSLGLTFYSSGSAGAVCPPAQQGLCLMHRSARLLASIALATVAAAVAGCASTGSQQWPEGAFASAQTPRTEADWRKEMEATGARYRADPKDTE